MLCEGCNIDIVYYRVLISYIKCRLYLCVVILHSPVIKLKIIGLQNSVSQQFQKIDFNFSVCLTLNPILLCVYYSCTLITFNCEEKCNIFHALIITTKRILGLKLVQIQVEIAIASI